MDIPVEVVLLSPDAVSECWLTAPKEDVPVKQNILSVTVHTDGYTAVVIRPYFTCIRLNGCVVNC